MNVASGQEREVVAQPSKRIAVFLCVLAATYFLASACYALLHYVDFASDGPRFARYVAGPGLIGLALLTASIVLPKHAAASLGLVVLGLLGGLFLFEAVMTASAVKQLLASLDSSSPLGERQVGGVEGLPTGYTAKRLNRALGTEQLSSAILSGIPNSITRLCYEGGKPIIYVADKYGFNNPNSSYDGPTDFIVLGDSFVEGMCLQPGKDMVSLLRQNHLASIGLGTRGAGPLFELAMLGRFGKPLRARHVVFAFFEGNDWENLGLELTLPWLHDALTENADYGPSEMSAEQLQKSKEMIEGLTTDRLPVIEVLKRTRVVRNFLALNQTATQIGLSYPKNSPEIPEYKNVLQRAKDMTENWGGDLTLLYIPQSIRFQGLLPHQFAYDNLHAKVMRAAHDVGIKAIDLVDLFADESEPQTFFGLDAHFSERGAAFAAGAIASHFAGDLVTKVVDPKVEHLQ
jgi:SGNH hydrolase-like domain, acetyltransferase AlgX